MTTLRELSARHQEAARLARTTKERAAHMAFAGDLASYAYLAENEARDTAIRAVVAAQWAVAIAADAWELGAITYLVSVGEERARGALRTLNRLAALPCAVEVVGE